MCLVGASLVFGYEHESPCSQSGRCNWEWLVSSPTLKWTITPSSFMCWYALLLCIPLP